jgi:hypothetical protein
LKQTIGGEYFDIAKVKEEKIHNLELHVVLPV